MLFPFEQDANLFACQADDPAGELALLLRNAVWMGAGTAPSRPAPAPVEAQDAAPAVLLEQPGGEEKGEKEAEKVVSTFMHQKKRLYRARNTMRYRYVKYA